MPSVSRQLLLLTTLLFNLTAQAAQDGKQEVQEGLASPSAARNFSGSESRQPEIGRHENQNGKLNELEDYQRSNRYGIGYEMRQGGRSSTQGGCGHGR